MRRVLILLFVSSLLAAPAFAQSGRKGANPKPSPPPVSTDFEQLQIVTPKKSSPPQFVDGERIYKSKEVDQKAQILKRPNPRYTREAERRMTRGNVIVRLILSADETVKQIEIVSGLPDGLSEKAIEAARQIKFKPAIKDGKPVSTWVEIEYQFRIY